MAQALPAGQETAGFGFCKTLSRAKTMAKMLPLAAMATTVRADRELPRDRQPERVVAPSSRRFLVGIVAAAAAIATIGSEARAFSLGSSGPKSWLKEQKKRTAQFLLKPIFRSREYLQNALAMLTGESSDRNYAQAVDLVKFAARDCIPFEAGSLLDLQTRTGVEVCTFRLLVKNAASLLDDDDPTKVSAYEALDGLIRSFVALDRSIAGGPGPTKSDIDAAFSRTYEALDVFETGIRQCLGIA